MIFTTWVHSRHPHFESLWKWNSREWRIFFQKKRKNKILESFSHLVKIIESDKLCPSTTRLYISRRLELRFKRDRVQIDCSNIPTWKTLYIKLSWLETIAKPYYRIPWRRSRLKCALACIRTLRNLDNHLTAVPPARLPIWKTHVWIDSRNYSKYSNSRCLSLSLFLSPSRLNQESTFLDTIRFPRFFSTFFFFNNRRNKRLKFP